MNKFFLSIYDRLSRNKSLSIALLLIVTALCVFSALRLDYKENIADFLPTDLEKEKYTSVYDDLSNQGQITVIFAADTTKLVGDEALDALMDAMDAFETNWKTEDTALLVNDLRCKVDESQVFDAIDFIRENQALFLTETDYHRMDSLLAEPDYVATCMGNIKRILSMPTVSFVVDGVKADPLNLYSPSLQRLNALNATEGYRVEDEYLFNGRGDMGFAFFSSPFSGSDTRGNAQLVALIDKVIEQTEAISSDVHISAVGAPTIAVTNAQQIKKDSYLSVALAIVLIFGILMFTMARKRNLIWLGNSVLFGWIFALAIIALFKSSISIIVVGIGSVIVGIAVNYPLHFLDHIKQQPDKREALKDVIQPLVIGNLTTVAAFACLVFVKAEAMRDLGLFGALMLVGTMLFVMVFLPLFAVAPKKTKRLFVDDGKASSETWRKIKLYAFWPLVIITLILSYFSQETAFDADLHNINFMTEQQQKDLAQEVFSRLGVRLSGPAAKLEYEALLAIQPHGVLLLAADYCRRNNFSLEDMHWVLDRWKGKGYQSEDSVKEYLDKQSGMRGLIRDVYETCGHRGNPTIADTILYQKWHRDWGYNHEISCTRSGIGTGATITK